MHLRELIKETKEPGEYVYHAAYLPDLAAGLKSVVARGLVPSKTGYAGPGVYFAYDPEGGYYHVSKEEATLFRVKWTDLVNKFGVYPKNRNGIQRDDDEIIVPGAVPAQFLEVEYFPDEWWDLQSAMHASEGPPIDEDWKSALGNVAFAGAVAAGGAGGMAAKQAVQNYFSGDKAPTAAVQQVQQTPKVDTKKFTPQAKQAEPTKKEAPKNIVVKPITDNPLETVLLKTAKASGLQGAELAAFMAQCAHETLDFKRLVEFGGSLDFRKYDPKYAPKKAKALGNKHVGDGARYKGRGYIQITGRWNYKQAGQELGLPLEKHPELLEKPEIAAKVSVWFWKHRVQPSVDNFMDVNQVTKPINPGMRGLEDRKENFKTYLKVAMAGSPNKDV